MRLKRAKPGHCSMQRSYHSHTNSQTIHQRGKTNRNISCINVIYRCRNKCMYTHKKLVFQVMFTFDKQSVKVGSTERTRASSSVKLVTLPTVNTNSSQHDVDFTRQTTTKSWCYCCSLTIAATAGHKTYALHQLRTFLCRCTTAQCTHPHQPNSICALTTGEQMHPDCEFLVCRYELPPHRETSFYSAGMICQPTKKRVFILQVRFATPPGSEFLFCRYYLPPHQEPESGLYAFFSSSVRNTYVLWQLLGVERHSLSKSFTKIS